MMLIMLAISVEAPKVRARIVSRLSSEEAKAPSVANRVRLAGKVDRLTAAIEVGGLSERGLYKSRADLIRLGKSGLA